MDPISITLAAATFISLAKDLTDISQDVASFIRTMARANKILQRFGEECIRLTVLLERLSEPKLLAAGGALTAASVSDLQDAATKLQAHIDELKVAKAKRLRLAFDTHKLEAMLKDVESAKGYAQLALQLLSVDLALSQMNLLALQHARQEELHSQAMLALQIATKSTISSDAQNAQDCESKLEPELSISALTAQSIRRRRPYKRKEYTLKPWFVSKAFTMVLEGDHRHWTSMMSVRQTIRRDASILDAIHDGDVQRISALLRQGVFHVDDLIECAHRRAPSPFDSEKLYWRKQSWLQLPPEQQTILTYGIYHSKDPLHFINLVAQYVDVQRDYMALWRVLKDVANHLLSSAQLLAGYKTTYQSLIQSFDLDLVYEWPSGRDLSFFMIELGIVDSDVGTLPIHYDAAPFLAARQRALNINAQREQQLRMTTMDPCSFYLAKLEDVTALYSVSWSPQHLSELRTVVKDWLLHAALSSWDGHDCNRNTENKIRQLLIAGACPISTVHGQSPVQTISRRISHPFRVDMDILSDVWLPLLIEAGYDIHAYLLYEQRWCTQHIQSWGKWQWYRVRLHHVELERPSKIELHFELRWQPRLWTYRQVPGEWPLSRMSRTDRMQRYCRDNDFQRRELLDTQCMSCVLRDDQMERVLGLPEFQILNTQDDHDIVSRSALRARRLRPDPRRSRSQPRPLLQRPSKAKTYADSWLKHCHICPLEEGSWIHWCNGHAAFDVEFRNCYHGCSRAQVHIPHHIPDVKPGPLIFEDYWLKELLVLFIAKSQRENLRERFYKINSLVGEDFDRDADLRHALISRERLYYEES